MNNSVIHEQGVACRLDTPYSRFFRGVTNSWFSRLGNKPLNIYPQKSNVHILRHIVGICKLAYHEIFTMNKQKFLSPRKFYYPLNVMLVYMQRLMFASPCHYIICLTEGEISTNMEAESYGRQCFSPRSSLHC